MSHYHRSYEIRRASVIAVGVESGPALFFETGESSSGKESIF